LVAQTDCVSDDLGYYFEFVLVLENVRGKRLSTQLTGSQILTQYLITLLHSLVREVPGSIPSQGPRHNKDV